MDGRRRWTVVLVLAVLLLGAVAWFLYGHRVDPVDPAGVDTVEADTGAEAELIGTGQGASSVVADPAAEEVRPGPDAEAIRQDPSSTFARVLARIMRGAVHIIDEAARVYTPPGDRDVWRRAWGDVIGRLTAAQGAIDGHLRVAVALARVATAVEDPDLSGLLIEGIAGRDAGALRVAEPPFQDLLEAIRNHLLVSGDTAAAERLASLLARDPESAFLLLVAIDWRAWERSLDLAGLDAPIEAARPRDGLVWAMKHIKALSTAERDADSLRWLDVFEKRMSPFARRRVLIYAFAQLGPRGATELVQAVVASGVPVYQLSLNGLASAWIQAPDRRGDLSDIATALAGALLEAKTPPERIQFANALFPFPAEDIPESAADLIRAFLLRPPDGTGDASTERAARANVFTALARKIDFPETLAWAEGAVTRSDLGVLSNALRRIAEHEGAESTTRSRVVAVARAALGTGDRLATESALKLISQWDLIEVRPDLEALVEGPGRNGEIVNGEVSAAVETVLSGLSR